MDGRKLDKWILYAETCFLILMIITAVLRSYDLVDAAFSKAVLNVFLVICTVGIINDAATFIVKRRRRKKQLPSRDEE